VAQETKTLASVRIFTILLIGAGLGLLAWYAPAFFIKDDKPPALPQLKAIGTGNVQIIMENRWRTAYREEKGIDVEYISAGSTAGISSMIDGEYPLAFTHAPLSDEQKKKAQEKGGAVVQIPVILCAVVPIYNLPQLKDKPALKFTADVLANIFLGKIERWNDPALKKLNEGVELPDTKITVVYREDSSGTTFIFSDYLAQASEAWRTKIGPAGNTIKWPSGVGERRSTGVASRVKKTEGAIGYADLMYAWNFELPHGAVQNKDKTAFIQASAENMTAAAQGLVADIPEDLTFKLTNQAGKDAYPICTAIWGVCYQSQPATSQKQVVDFLRWITHDGQKYAKGMSFAPLPPELVKRVEKKLETIKAQ
jgi:phosphate transport system substrate-binding protein